MRIAFVGCGYVFDIYMRTRWAHPDLVICGVFDVDSRRLAVVSEHYRIRAYASIDELLLDPEVVTVVNLTSIRSHFDVSLRSLRSGKHVYTEKPFTLDLEQTRALYREAASKNLIFVGAPCNVFSDAVMTTIHAVRQGAVGKPVLVYAELDDNPAHLMGLEKVQSPTGAPFPYAEELQEGCTVEHVGYHLAWICACFGPVVKLTATSHFLIGDKTSVPLDPSDTPDLSVACLSFEGGVVARVTCSWVAPRNHSFQVIGDQGEIRCDNIFHDQSPLWLERFSKVSLTSRKIFSLRQHRSLGSVFGLGGRRLRLVKRWKSYAVEKDGGERMTIKQRFVSRLRRKQVYAQDKLLGLAEMALSMTSRPMNFGPDFYIHLNELTLLIHGAGPTGIAKEPTTTFQAVELPEVESPIINYKLNYKNTLLEGLLLKLFESLHRR